VKRLTLLGCLALSTIARSAGAADGPHLPPSPPPHDFTLSGLSINSAGTITVRLFSHQAGRFSAAARTSRRTLSGSNLYGTGKIAKAVAGGLTLKIKPGAAARHALTAGRRLKLSVSVVFTPTGSNTHVTHGKSIATQNAG